MEELAANKQATEFAARVLVFVSRGFGHRGLEDPKGFVFGLSVSGKRNALNPQYRYTKKKSGCDRTTTVPNTMPVSTVTTQGTN